MKHISLELLLIILSVSLSCSHFVQGQKPNKNSIGSVTDSAFLFGRDVISTGMFERDAALSPDGKSFYFTVRFTRGMAAIVYSQNIDGRWSTPQVTDFSGRYYDLEPVFHPDGKRLFFVSNRPLKDGGKPKDFDIWYVERTKDGWSKPVNPGKPLNQEGNEFYPSFTQDGSVYFTAQREETEGGEDLYVCAYREGRYQPARNLGDSINTEKGEYNSFIAPDGSFIMYTSEGMGPGMGSGDLYISFRDQNGTWRKAINMGEKVNSPAFEYCPSLSGDGKTIFFTSQRMAPQLTKPPLEYNNLKQYHDQPQNGNGDIYRIGADIIGKLRRKVFH